MKSSEPPTFIRILSSFALLYIFLFLTPLFFVATLSSKTVNYFMESIAGSSTASFIDKRFSEGSQLELIGSLADTLSKYPTSVLTSSYTQVRNMEAMMSIPRVAGAGLWSSA